MKTSCSSHIEVLEARIAPAAVLCMSVDNDDKGLFQIDPATGAATRIGASGVTSMTVGLTETTDPYVLLGSEYRGLLKINADGSGATQIGNTDIEALAMDLKTGILYAAFNGDFFKVDPTTGANTGALTAPPNGEDVEGLAYNGAGKIFGVNSDADTLVSYDIVGNSWTTIGPVGINVVDPGLAFDPVAKLLYMKGSQSGNLYKIDPATGTATLIGDTGITAGGGLALIDNGLKIVNDKTATYTDGNGDLVTVKVTQGSLSASNFLLVPAPHGGAELWRLDLSDGEFERSDVTISAKKTKTGGDGLAHLGYLDGGTQDLGKVTIPGDLARIFAGDGNAARPAVAALTVGSMGVIDLSQGLDLDQRSDFNGDLGKLTIRGDFDQKQIFVAGHLGPVVIGGSMIGGGADLSGEIFASLTIKSATIGGSILGGDGMGSGRLFGDGNVGPVKVNGDVHGGDGARSGSIVSNQTLGFVTIGKSVIGGGGTLSGRIVGTTDVLGVKIGGALVGGDGSESGIVRANNGILLSVTVTESVIGGDGADSGKIRSATGIGPVKIGGSLVGGIGQHSGKVEAGQDVKSLTLGGSLVGGDGFASGKVEIGGTLGMARITGSIVGGEGLESAWLHANASTTGTSGPVSVGGDVVGTVVATALIWSENGSWTSVTVGGSLIGTDQLFSGGILAGLNLGKVTIKGSVIGNAAQDVIIRAGGLDTLPAGATKNVALTSLTVGGSVEHAQVLVGFGEDNIPNNGHVQIGDVKIGGNWSQSSITAGHTTGADGDFGTDDDTLIGAGPATIASRIASITIGGAVTGTRGGTDHFGFVAAQIGKFKAGAFQAPLTNALIPDVIEVGFFTGDVTVREIA